MKKRTIVTTSFALVVCALVSGGFLYLRAKAATRARETVKKALGGLSQVAGITYHTLEFSYISQEAAIKGVKVTLPGVMTHLDIEEIKISDVDLKHEWPHFMHLSMKGPNIPVSAEFMGELAASQIKNLGYSGIVVTSELDYRYSREDGTFDLNNLRIGAENMGSLSVKLALADIPQSVGQTMPTNPILAETLMGQSLDKVTIKKFEVQYEDSSLVRRVIEAMARENGQTREQFEVFMQTYLDSEVRSKAGQLKDAEGKILASLKRFIQNPGVLTFAIDPPAPVSIGDIKRLPPEKIPEVLKVQITAS